MADSPAWCDSLYRNTIFSRLNNPRPLRVVAANFHVDKREIVWSISIALAMRPVGALIFGGLADRFGRRRPLIACVSYFSAVTLLSAFAPNYATFVVLRALYGIGMGGYSGVGASLAVESAPRRRRGLISGLMQSGYPLGYLLAAVAMESVLPHLGWRAMFCAGFTIAILIFNPCTPRRSASRRLSCISSSGDQRTQGSTQSKEERHAISTSSETSTPPIQASASSKSRLPAQTRVDLEQ